MFLRKLNTLATLCNRRLSTSISSYPIFTSSQSLDKLYSNKSKVANPPEKSFEGDTFTGYIPMKKLEVTTSTSSGPGGQNVNRMYTKVTIKFHVDSSDWIPEIVRIRIKDLHKNSINKDGYWMIRSDKTRYQHLNMADCLDRLRCYIAEAAKPLDLEPDFETLEQIRKNQEKAAIKRLEAKKQRSLFKASKRMDF